MLKIDIYFDERGSNAQITFKTEIDNLVLMGTKTSDGYCQLNDDQQKQLITFLNK